MAEVLYDSLEKRVLQLRDEAGAQVQLHLTASELNSLLRMPWERSGPQCDAAHVPVAWLRHIAASREMREATRAYLGERGVYVARPGSSAYVRVPDEDYEEFHDMIASCVNCDLPGSDHAGDKCPFAPTRYRRRCRPTSSF